MGEILPITIAAHGSINAQLPVIATNPHKTPLSIATVSHLVFSISRNLVICFLKKKQEIPAAAGPKIVFMKALSACPASVGVDVPKVLPALKNNQPNHKLITPRPTIGIL